MQQEYGYKSALQDRDLQVQQSMGSVPLHEMQQQARAAIVEQLNPIHIIEELRMKLRGMEQRMDGTYARVSAPLMNETGVSEIILTVSSIVNQNTIMSSLDKDEIGRLILNCMDSIIDELVLNWKEYGIKDKINLDKIHNLIAHMTFPALKRALGSGERKFLSTTTVENISSAPRYMPQKKEGFFNKLKL